MADSQGATQYAATEWTVTIEIDDESLTVGPLAALVVANKTEHPSIGRVVEEHGLETLQNCITEARVYERGETTTRQFADDTGLSYGLAFEALAAIAELLGFESEGEPMTSDDASDDRSPSSSDSDAEEMALASRSSPGSSSPSDSDS